MRSCRTQRTTVAIFFVVATFMYFLNITFILNTGFDAEFISTDEIVEETSKDKDNNNNGIDSHNSVRSNDSSSKTKRKRTLVILEKVGKTGTTSLKDHFFEVMNVDDGRYWWDQEKWKKKYPRKKNAEELCFRYANHFDNGTHPEFCHKGYKDHYWSDTQVYPPCSCKTDLFVSHMTRFPEKMDDYLGSCNWTNVDILSVIPLRFDTRIDSEIQFGHKKLCLDPTKSILDNCMGYKFNPYEEYGHNFLATRTCIFNFLDETFVLPKSRVTKDVRGEKDRFECTTKVCEESVEFVKREEAKHIQQLQEKFPVCDVQELHSLLLLPLTDEGRQEEGHNRTLTP